MPALQVRELPQDLYDELQRRAMREHRSMAQQTIVALEEHLQGDPQQIAPASHAPEWSDGDERERQERAQRKRELLGRIRAREAAGGHSPVEPAQVVRLVRDMRDERADGLVQALGDSGSGEGGPR